MRLISTLPSPPAAQEWACKALRIRLCIMTGHGKPTEGNEPSLVLPEPGKEGDAELSPVWLWSHMSYDGEGHGSEHFSYICQDEC